MRLRSVLVWCALAATVGPATLLTLARLLEPGGEVWVRLVAFTPLALPLYAAALALLLARALVPRTPRRPVWLVAALLVAVPLGLHARWFSPQVLGPNPPPAAGAQTLRILTANLWHGRVDGLEVVDAAARARADLLVLEEVTPGVLATMESGGLADAWPFRSGVPKEGIAGTMVFSRFELSDSARIPTLLDSWGLTVAAPDGPLRLLAVHPSAPIDAAAWRSDQTALLGSSTGADLVVGDFNAGPDHASMRAWAASGLHSVAERANEGWQPTWPANGKYRLAGLVPLPPLVQIDQVLVGSRLAAISTRTVRLDGTDHLAVVAEVAAS